MLRENRKAEKNDGSAKRARAAVEAKTTILRLCLARELPATASNAQRRSGNGHLTKQVCPDVARAVRVSARAALSVTARCCETTSRASPSLPSAVWRAVVA